MSKLADVLETETSGFGSRSEEVFFEMSCDGSTSISRRRFRPTSRDSHRAALIADLVGHWSELGADPAMLALLKQVTRL